MTRRFSELVAPARANPQRRARIEQHKRAIYDALELARIRNEQGVTQQELARALGTTQANVSRIEHQEDIYLSTLRKYVAALGGQLEVKAVFPDRAVIVIAASSET